MATEAQLIEAIRRADKAGDAQSVRALGAALKQMQSAPKGPDYSKLTGDQARGAYQQGRQRVQEMTRNLDAKGRSQAIQNYERSAAATALRQRMNDTSPVMGLLLGAMKPVDNAATWVSKIPGVGPALDRASQTIGLGTTQEKVSANSRARQTNTRKGAQVAGNILGTAPTIAAPGGAVVQGLLSGALLSERPTDLAGVATDAAIGGAFGKLGEVSGKAIGGLLGGKNAPNNVRLLADEGITMTPGQRGGRFANFVEDKVLGSIPFVSDVTAAARNRGANDLRVATANRVLAPIGTKVERGTQINNEAVAKIQDLAETAYDNAISQLSVRLDDDLVRNLDDAIIGADREIGQEGAEQLSRYAAYLKERLAQGLSGDALKREIQNLRSVASEKMKADSLMGGRMWGLHNALDDALTRQGGAAAPAYRNARETMSLLQRFNDAASKSTNGEFGPTQLLQAAKRRGYGTTTANIASGEAKMLDLANAAADVMRNTTANSGTVPRALATGGLLGGGYGITTGAIDPVTTGLATGAALTPYIPGLDRALQAVTLYRPELARQMAQPILRNSRYLGPLGVATGFALSGQ